MGFLSVQYDGLYGRTEVLQNQASYLRTFLCVAQSHLFRMVSRLTEVLQ